MDAYALIGSSHPGNDVEHAFDERSIGLTDSDNADQIVVGAAQLGVEHDRLFQRRTRLGKASAFGQDPAQEPETIGAAGIEFDSSPGFALGVGGLALDHQSPDQVQPSISVLAVRCRRAIRIAGRAAQAALGEQVSESAHRFGSPPHRSGDAIGLDRLVIPALGLERQSLPIAGASEIVLKREGPILGRAAMLVFTPAAARARIVASRRRRPGLRRAFHGAHASISLLTVSPEPCA